MTPETLESCYRLLLTTLPFRRWNLPHPDRVNFAVSLHRDRLAHHRAYKDGSAHDITVSAHGVKDLDLLTRCMAHEMVHMRQDKLGMRDTHGRGFQSLAKVVCRRHGWDLAKF